MPLCALAPTPSPPLRAQDMFALLARSQVLPGEAPTGSQAERGGIQDSAGCLAARRSADGRNGLLQRPHIGCCSAVAGGLVVAVSSKSFSFVQRERVHSVRCGKRGTCSSRKRVAMSGCVRVLVSIPVHVLTGSSGLARLAVAARGPMEAAFLRHVQRVCPPPSPLSAPDPACARQSHVLLPERHLGCLVLRHALLVWVSAITFAFSIPSIGKHAKYFEAGRAASAIASCACKRNHSWKNKVVRIRKIINLMCNSRACPFSAGVEKQRKEA